MPIYEFRCISCSNQWEQLSPMGLVESVCRSCGDRAPQIISCPAPPVILGEGGNLNRFVDKHRYKWEPGKMLGKSKKDDLRAGTKVYDMEFGKSERDRLAAKVQFND